MNSDIQFGDVEQAEPQKGLRPDQDAHFATAMVGQIGPEELLIYVDLDVMRDMEAHALSNTRVELGGVMLGKQMLDDSGRPFVVITDSLRAEHYEATKGSFKFTHDTWSRITRQRDEFRPELEMVGWYHTHPGWSVFLSGMDLFICNNFFNRPLDVALVIDPCEQDRGWFQWTDENQPRTQRTGGFIMTTGRYRHLELDQFARLYNKEPIMTLDPRYSGNNLSGPSSPVTMMNQRNPVFELAIVGMLCLQFMIMAMLAWKLMSGSTSEGQTRLAELESKVESVSEERVRSMREKAYQEVLSTLVAQQTGQPGLVDRFTELRTENERMLANLEGQLARTEALSQEATAAQMALADSKSDLKSIKEQLSKTRQELKEKKAALADNENGVEPASDLAMPWWWAALGGLAVALVGGALGFSLGRRDDGNDSPAQDHRDAGAVEAADSQRSPLVFETKESPSMHVVSQSKPARPNEPPSQPANEPANQE